MDPTRRLQAIARRRAAWSAVRAWLRRWTTSIIIGVWVVSVLLALMMMDADGASPRRSYVLRDGTDPIARIVVRASCAAEDGWAGVRVVEYDPPRIVLGCVRP